MDAICFDALLCQKYDLLFAGSSINTVAVISCVSHFCLVRCPELVNGLVALGFCVGRRPLVGWVIQNAGSGNNISGNDFGGRCFFLLKEWSLRTVTNFLNFVSHIFQTKHAGEVYVGNISWFELSQLF